MELKYIFVNAYVMFSTEPKNYDDNAISSPHIKRVYQRMNTEKWNQAE